MQIIVIKPFCSLIPIPKETSIPGKLNSRGQRIGAINGRPPSGVVLLYVASRAFLHASEMSFLRLEVDAPPKATVQDLLQLSHLLLNRLELRLQRAHFFINGLC